MRSKLLPLPVFLVVACVAVLAAGCDAQEQQDAFADAASEPPEGITQTTAEGRVTDEDEDDWRTAPLYAGILRVDPAFPNPVPLTSNAGPGLVQINLQIIAANSVRGGLFLQTRDPGDGRFFTLATVDPVEAADFGFHLLTFSAAEIGARGLHRLLLFDGRGELVSYGDLLIE